MARRGRGPFHGSARHTPLPHSPVEPAAALTAIGAAIYGWDIGSGSLAWGPNAAEALGIPDIGIFTVAKAFEEAVESQGGASRADAIAASEASDEGDGVPYRAHYALRTRADRLIMVEDTGRWFADADGRPARARGTILTDLCPSGQNGLAAGLRDRAALLAQIVDDVAEAQRSRHALTLVVGLVDGAVPDPKPPRRASPAASAPDAPAGPLRSLCAGPFRSCPGLVPRGRSRECARAPPRPRRPRRIGALSAPRRRQRARPRGRCTGAPEAGRGGARVGGTGPLRPLQGAGPGAGRGPARHSARRRDRRPQREAACRRAPAGARFSDAGSRARDARSPPRSRRTGRLRGGYRRGGRAGRALAPGGYGHLEAAADHLASHLVARVALPIAPSTLHDGEWLNALAAHLGARPGIESRLVVEVPESTLADPATRGRLTAMKALGVGIMVSGFGGGRAAMKQLRHLPVDLLKIDGALVGNLPRSTDDRLLVRGSWISPIISASAPSPSGWTTSRRRGCSPIGASTTSRARYAGGRSFQRTRSQAGGRSPADRPEIHGSRSAAEG